MANRSTYHHGDLRRSVLKAAVEVITQQGPDALSLRDLARRAGVSHAAPAHHFGDRAGLLTALAVEGHQLLATSLGEAAGLREMGMRYVRFAADHPAHFQVMFRPDLIRPDDPEFTLAQALTAERLRKGVASLPQPDTADARLTGIAAWSLAHGFATLLLSGSLSDPIGAQDAVDYFGHVADQTFRT
ncbi:TetR/AcrR family transcriptional regulator [Streptomyces sp. A7024]|uniref:TetR/AcrR family transcriptional regulator n=1 Tax=Streptomyces coryli TaxID=1128680 RepID=A0A6G4U4E7_9ACTN|nr:TetR/AcrR family transcriptional regulator [Streptomyces coryli]NGN66248.1 TetR/AcrR family transcriptional regulator [Streptomyces coryli]